MSPVGVGASRFASDLEIGTAKLWVLLIGVNQYQDPTFPALKYAAIDCQGISKALVAATDSFPHKEFLIHNDLVEQTPSLARVEFSLRRLIAEAQVQDTILIYFSGHGVVEPIDQQTVLCLYDTDRQDLLNTGLPIQAVLELLRHCAAHSQLLWLDACHSGNMRSPEQSPKPQTGVELNQQLRSDRDWSSQLNSSTQLLASLRQAVSNRGFYALLSCDEGQQSWEFPDLGHGVFSYYLMRGLSGAAADDQGIIDADSLYRYVYRQTMQYIDRTNQQVRLANQIKRERGEMICAPEYSQQTPKRIVSGVGEIILGVVAATITPDRSALIIDGGAEDFGSELDTLSHVLTQEGKFTLDRFAPPEDTAARSLAAIKDRIHTFLGSTAPTPQNRSTPVIATRLLYLRGQIAAADPEQAQAVTKDAALIIGSGAKLSRAWLGQKLHQSSQNQQILIIDAPGTDFTIEWVEALKLAAGNLCVIVCASPLDDAALFIQVLIEALISAAPQIGVPVVSLFTRLQTTLNALGVPCDLSLSGTQELIEIVPASEIKLVELVELAAEIVIPSEIPLPAASREFATTPDPTFGQDHTYLQSTPDQIIAVASLIEASLESILAKLVGPIAPTLIKRAQAENSATMIDNLRLLLPNQFTDIFNQQVQLLLIEPVISPPPQIEQQVIEPSIPERSFHVASGRGVAIQQPVASANRAFATAPAPALSQDYPDLQPPPDQITAVAPQITASLESILVKLVGPIAPTLIKRAQAEDSATMIDNLRLLLPNQFTDIFNQQVQLLLMQPVIAPPPNIEQQVIEPNSPDQSSHSANSRGVVIQQPIEVNVSLLRAYEQELNLAIGPISHYIINRTRKAQPYLSAPELIAALASHITDADQADLFRRKCNEKY